MKLLIIVTCLALAACGQQADEREPESAASDSPFEPLTDQLEQAEAVQETVEQHKRELDAALEKAEDERR